MGMYSASQSPPLWTPIIGAYSPHSGFHISSVCGRQSLAVPSACLQCWVIQAPPVAKLHKN